METIHDQKTYGHPIMRWVYKFILVFGSLIGSPDVRRYKQSRSM